MTWKKIWPTIILNAYLKTFANVNFKFKTFLIKKAEHALFRLKTAFYESGEKTGRLLARQLKEQNVAHIIPAIRVGALL